MSTPTALSDAEVQRFLEGHPGWAYDGGSLVRTYEAPTFFEGITFVTHVAKLAEAVNHHPDIDIRWRKVTLRFVTHDAGNRVTDLDTRLAGECDQLFAAHVKLD